MKTKPYFILAFLMEYILSVTLFQHFQWNKPLVTPIFSRFKDVA